MPYMVSAATVSSQLLNDIHYPRAVDGNSIIEYESDVGLLNPGQLITGVQFAYAGNPVPYINVEFRVWRTEVDYKAHNTSAIILHDTPSSCVIQSPGIQNCTLGLATTTSSYLYYTVWVGLLDHVIDPASPDYVLGTSLATGRTLIIDSTTNYPGQSLYFQVYSGQAQQYFTPDPNFGGFSTSSINTVCELPSSILDVAGGVRYGICAAVSFLFIPNQSVVSSLYSIPGTFNQRIPFSYFVQINTALQPGSVASSTFFNIGFYADQISTSSIVNLPHIFIGLSTSTISTYYPDSLRLGARTLISYVIWFGFAVFIYQSVFGILFPGKRWLVGEPDPDN